jgi:hypothetical protein
MVGALGRCGTKTVLEDFEPNPELVSAKTSNTTLEPGDMLVTSIKLSVVV